MRFDLETYQRRSERLVVDDLDFGSFAPHPLPVPALRCIRYMHDVEHHTVCYLRDLLVSPAHADPEITTFLTLWNYEEHWHGEALGAVLDAHGEPCGSERVRAVRRRDRRLRPWSLAASLVGDGALGSDITAVHLTWGAVNEWTAQAGYARLLTRTRHPVLDELLRRLMRQEGRHIDFYATQASARLERSRRARRIVRLALVRAWRPVGTNVMPASESAFIGTWLFGGPDGLAAARRIDRRIDRLPGLEGLGLVERARARVLQCSTGHRQPGDES
ncbi:MAG: ferritin-like domain-containing protein [Acidimicrobiales bacterium]